MFFVVFGHKLLLAEDSVRNGMSKKVANLSLQGELDLKLQKPMARNRWRPNLLEVDPGNWRANLLKNGSW